MKSSDHSTNNIPTIIENNKEYISNDEKAEVLANGFKLVSSDERKSFILNNKSITMKQNSVDSILDEDFNFQALKQTVKSLKNTAPGQDNITNEIIKHLPESYLMVLLDFYNFSCVTACYL